MVAGQVEFHTHSTRPHLHVHSNRSHFIQNNNGVRGQSAWEINFPTGRRRQEREKTSKQNSGELSWIVENAKKRYPSHRSHRAFVDELTKNNDAVSKNVSMVNSPEKGLISWGRWHWGVPLSSPVSSCASRRTSRDYHHTVEADIPLTSWYGKYPILPGGCLGFLPSTVPPQIQKKTRAWLEEWMNLLP